MDIILPMHLVMVVQAGSVASYSDLDAAATAAATVTYTISDN